MTTIPSASANHTATVPTPDAGALRDHERDFASLAERLDRRGRRRQSHRTRRQAAALSSRRSERWDGTRVRCHPAGACEARECRDRVAVRDARIAVG